MNTGQTMLTIAALSLLSFVTLRFYSSMGQTGVTLSQSSAGLTATTVITSFIEFAQNTAFDSVTKELPQNVVLSSPSTLTPVGKLGPEGETSYEEFNDFDDFNGATIDYKIGDPERPNEIYKVHFDVYYVNPDNINQISNSQTFLKRMDIKAWRSYPSISPEEATSFDTVRMSTLYAYFKFNPI